MLCFNAHHEPLGFTLPPAEFGAAWLPVIYTADSDKTDDAEPSPASGRYPHASGATITIEARAVMVLQVAETA